MRAAIYARYSSDKQREESIDAQFMITRDYCANKGYTVVREYADEALSGKSTVKRVQYKAMLADAKKDIFDVIVFHKIDRNSRNELDYYITKDLLNRTGIKYEYAAQNIDSSPSGQLVEGVLVACAANYLRNLAEETKKGLNLNAHKAQFNGGTPPLGYDVDSEKHYVINELEANIVKIIFDRFYRGVSYNQIIAELNERSYKTKRGSTFGKNSLYDLLRNEKYVGTYSYNKTLKSYGGKRNTHKNTPSAQLIVKENAIPAIIDKHIFEKVQEIMNFRSKTKASSKAIHPYLLSGLLSCGECGSSMTGHRHSARGKYYYYYVCSSKERKLQCTSKQIRCDVLEDIVINKIIESVFGSSDKNKIKQLLIEEQKKADAADKSNLNALINRRRGAEVRLDNLYNIIELGNADNRDLKRFKSIKEELNILDSDIEKERESVELTPPSFEEIMKSLEVYKDVLANKKDTQELRAFLTTFVQSIIVSETKVEIHMNFNSVVGFVVPKARNLQYRQLELTLIAIR